MAGEPLADKVLQRTVQTLHENDGNISEVARILEISRSTVSAHVAKAALRGLGVDILEFPQFPADDMAIGDIVDHMADRFKTRQDSHAAHEWYTVKVKDKKPVGVLWFGDPHIDDNGCNWPVLKRHCELCKTVPGLVGANIGDTTNNWSGRLARLYAEQDTSVKTARRLAAWFMLDSGVKWLIWLIGNHDQWGDGAAVLAQMARRHGTQKLICHDWESRFILEFPNGTTFRIWAAHDFPGNSMWNPLHGPLKASKMSAEADLYVCGHKHNWGVYHYENPDRGLIQTAMRVRGYKFMDDYARKIGKIEQQGGCAILTIFDPGTQQITTFEDIETGVKFLTFLRS